MSDSSMTHTTRTHHRRFRGTFDRITRPPWLRLRDGALPNDVSTASSSAVIVSSREPGPPEPRLGLAIGAGGLAALGFGGAAIMVAGLVIQTTRHRRVFDLDNPIIDALVLTGVIGVPNTIVAAYAWSGDRRTNLAAVTAGGLAMGWTFVDGTTRRRISVLDPLCGFAGIAMLLVGTRGLRSAS